MIEGAVKGYTERGMKVENSPFKQIEIIENVKGGEVFVVNRTHENGVEVKGEEYDQVFNCLGRQSNTQSMGLENIGIMQTSRGGQIKGMNQGVAELTQNPNVFAIGDVLHGSGRNNPAAEIGGRRVAAMISRLLKHPEDSQNIYADFSEFRYSHIPLTVFSCPSVSMIGLTQPEAEQMHGKENIKCITLKRRGMVDDFSGNKTSQCIYKVISLKESRRIIGLHYLGDKGEEILYGLSIAMSHGLTLDNLIDSFTIHPSFSEVFHKNALSNESYSVESC